MLSKGFALSEVQAPQLTRRICMQDLVKGVLRLRVEHWVGFRLSRQPALL